MKKLSLLAGVMLALTFGGCQRSPQQNEESGKMSARAFFEQQVSQTKSGEQERVKPMPGAFVPQWDAAVTTQNGDLTSVEVPIADPTYRYYAVREHSHAEGEHCDHQGVEVIQKLVVQTRGEQQSCYVATIVPAEQDAVQPLTGFIAYHNLDGSVARIEEFDHGTLSRTAQPDQYAIVDQITAGVRIYEVEIPLMMSYDPICDICNSRCGAPYDMYPNYDTSTSAGLMAYRQNLANQALHCTKCSRLKTNCICPDTELPGGEICPVCSRTNCTEHKSTGGYPTLTPHIHSHILSTIFGGIPLLDISEGCRSMDGSSDSRGTEYIHGIWFPSQDKAAMQAKMRYQFTGNILIFFSKNPYRDYSLGEAIHPLLDMYLPLQTRVNMLNYYSYETAYNLLDGIFTPYRVGETIGNTGPCVNNVRKAYNAVMNLGPSATAAQLDAIFDTWVYDNRNTAWDVQ